MIKRVIICLSLLVAILLTVTLPSTVDAVDIWGGGACSDSGSDICKNQENADTSSLATGIVNLVLYIAGLISVIMIIVSGMMYISAHGSSDKVANAKRTLIFAVAGLVVSALSVAIVSFVNSRILSSVPDSPDIATINLITTRR
jgi:cytochrome bd-type quinol oxidase subunit 2